MRGTTTRRRPTWRAPPPTSCGPGPPWRASPTPGRAPTLGPSLKPQPLVSGCSLGLRTGRARPEGLLGVGWATCQEQKAIPRLACATFVGWNGIGSYSMAAAVGALRLTRRCGWGTQILAAAVAAGVLRPGSGSSALTCSPQQPARSNQPGMSPLKVRSPEVDLIIRLQEKGMRPKWSSEFVVHSLNKRIVWARAGPAAGYHSGAAGSRLGGECRVRRLWRPRLLGGARRSRRRS